MFKFGSSSLKKLEGVDKRLVEVLKEAISISPIDFTITEGLRTLERQKELVREGKSKTLKSKHLDGLAVDVCACVRGRVSYNEKDAIFLAGFILAVARTKGLNVRVGAIWNHTSLQENSFIDAFHIEIIN